VSDAVSTTFLPDLPLSVRAESLTIRRWCSCLGNRNLHTVLLQHYAAFTVA
jgi:hypothetical protein